LTYTIGYSVFIITNFNRISIAFNHPISEKSIAIALSVILAPLATIRDISSFAACNVIAVIFIIFSVLTIDISSIVSVAENGLGKGFAHYTSLFSAIKLIGISTSAYEINAALIPIYTQAENKEKYHKVHYPAVIFVATLYLSIGLFGYLAFAKEVKGPVTLSFDQSLWYIVVAELSYIVALIPTMLIQIYPAVIVVCHYTVNKLRTGRCKDVLQIILRILMILVPIWLAVAFDTKFETILAIVGNLVCAPMSYFFPGLIHYLVAADTRRDKVRDIALMIFGGSCFVIATILIIVDLFNI